jgi:hypothetical protein
MEKLIYLEHFGETVPISLVKYISEVTNKSHFTLAEINYIMIIFMTKLDRGL